MPSESPIAAAAIPPIAASAFDIVTKSFTFAPCALAFTITCDSVPVVVFVVNVTPLFIVALSGVISLNDWPSSI